MKKPKEYVSNKELYKEMIVSLNLGKLTPTAQNMLVLMCNKTASMFSFQSDELKQECISTAYEHIFRSWIHYDLEYTNAFAYFTEGIKRGIYHGYYKYFEFIYDGQYKKHRVKFLHYNNMDGADSFI